MSSLRLANVRPWGGDPTDLHITDGVFVADPVADAEVVDGDGRLVLPALVDAHAHLDKTTYGGPYRPHTAGRSLASLIENERVNRGTLPPVAVRAGALLDRYIAYGVLHVRSHVDVDPEIGLNSIAGVLEAAASRPVTMEIAAYPQSGLLKQPGMVALMGDAIDAGAHLLGSIDPAGFDGDPIRHLDTIFGLAAEKRVGLDIHLHDSGTLGAWQIDRIVERTHAFGMRGRVTISHCFALSTVDERRQGSPIEAMAGADIALTTVAPGLTPNPPLAELAAAGVRVGVGNDSVRGLWNPYGTGDLLEKVMLLVTMSGLRNDADIESVLRMATHGGASVIGLPDYGLTPGCAANLILIPVSSPVEAIVERPQRLVIARGRLL